MKGRIIANWGRVDIASAECRRYVRAALQHFMDEPLQKDAKAVMQHFASTGDFPTSVLDVLRTFQQGDYYDAAFEQVFDVIDMTGSERNGFELLDVEDGLTFEVVPEGQKAKIFKFGGAKATVSFSMIGAGLGWHRRLFDDREYWNLERNAITFRNKWYSKRASTAYALIDAIGSGQNLAWQAVTPAGVANTDQNYNAIRDINTINKACETILLAADTKGYGVTPQSRFVLLAPIQLMARITRALGLLNASISGAQRGLVYNVTPQYTTGLADSTKYYVCLPGQKAIFADRMRLTIFDRFDAESYSDISVGWGRYGGAIGDVTQFQRCATS